MIATALGGELGASAGNSKADRLLPTVKCREREPGIPVAKGNRQCVVWSIASGPKLAVEIEQRPKVDVLALEVAENIGKGFFIGDQAGDVAALFRCFRVVDNFNGKLKNEGLDVGKSGRVVEERAFVVAQGKGGVAHAQRTDRMVLSADFASFGQIEGAEQNGQEAAKCEKRGVPENPVPSNHQPR